MIRALRSCAPVLAIVVALGGCATDESAKQTTPARRAAPTTRYNLVGYPAAFKEGYADACANPRRRNEQRMKDDTDYSMGWQDGNSVCRRR